jgi:hypothetical protein
MRAMRTWALVLPPLALLAGCGGSRHSTEAAVTVKRTTATRAVRKPTLAPTPAQRLGFPALAPGRVPGYVMVADRNNDRIIIVNPRTNRVVWVFPRPGDVKAGQSFHDPDDAFFTPGYRSVSTNEEYNQTIAEIDVRTHRIVWSFGHAGVRGSAYGYLSNPDDAYKLPNGLYMVADIQNCRVLFVNRAHRVVRAIGHAGACGHNPPQGLSSPNGATPLPDGGVLVTEIGGWVDRISRTGRLMWTIRTPTSYPSDAQLLPNGNVLVAGFNTPGRVDEITPQGRVVWTYAPTGYWSLDRPSLAINWPNGLIAITDDWHHRIVVIDKRTKRVVWSYGHLDQPSSAPGFVNKPDGLDLLPAVPTRASAVARTRARDTSSHASVQRVGSLPEPLSKASAVALPGGRLMVLGGESGGASTDQVLLGTPARLRRVGRLPVPTHDAAAALRGGSVYLFGGGQAASVDAVVRVDPQTGRAVAAGRIGEPLSDLGAVVVGGKTYLVGGYTGSKYATAVLRYPGAQVVSRLPMGTRYAGVAALGGRIYVAGGLTVNGATDAVYEVALPGPVRQIATLPRPIAHAGMAELGGALYLVGGTEVLRLGPSGAVSVAAHLPVSLADPAVVAAGGRLIIVGGGTNAVYAFRP